MSGTVNTSCHVVDIAILSPIAIAISRIPIMVDSSKFEVCRTGLCQVQGKQ